MANNRKPAQRNEQDTYRDANLDESLMNSPARRLPIRPAPSHARQTSIQQGNRLNDSAKEQHEARLREELASVRKVNEAIEGVLQSLEKAKSNMKNVNQTVGNASALLNLWTRILSQTEHNQRLILDPSWQGASQDITDIEDEAQEKQRTAERREAEEQERRATMARKAEEGEKRRTEMTTTTAKPRAGGRGRGVSRGSSTNRAGYVSIGGSTGGRPGSGAGGGPAVRRTTSGMSRGTVTRSTRGRGL